MKQGQNKKKLVDLDISEQEIKNNKLYKIRVTSFIDGDIYEWLKHEASCGKGRGRYQTLLNEILRQAMTSQQKSRLPKKSETINFKTKNGTVIIAEKKDSVFIKRLLSEK